VVVERELREDASAGTASRGQLARSEPADNPYHHLEHTYCIYRMFAHTPIWDHGARVLASVPSTAHYSHTVFLFGVFAQHGHSTPSTHSSDSTICFHISAPSYTTPNSIRLCPKVYPWLNRGYMHLQVQAQGLSSMLPIEPFRHPLLISHREGNTQDDGRQQHPMLGVALTGNLLFTMSWVVGLGVPKALYANSGRSLVSPTLDWVGGIILTLM
jgi:hypothetical protein